MNETAEIPAEGDGFTWKDGILSTKKDTLIPVRYEKKKGYDVYLQLTGLSISGQSIPVEVLGEGFRTKALVRGSRQVYNIGREDYLFHLGYADEDKEAEVKLQFGSGTCELASARILYVPMEGYEEKIAALNEEPLREEQITDGAVSGKVSLSTPKMVVLSVPAADGWTLRVDGTRTQAVTVNMMYQGVFLPEGDHQIELTYRTPGLTAGRCIALPAILVWIILTVIGRKKRAIADA